MRRAWVRLGIGLLTVGGTAVAGMPGALPAQAALIINGANIGGDAGCHNLNPALEEHRTAFTAVADNTRGWMQIQSVSVTAAAATADGITEAKVVVTLCGAVPNLPAPGSGDGGAAYFLCFAPNSSEPIVSRTSGVVVGTDPVTAAPILDGPYPASQGFRFCTWTSISAVTGLDYGLAIYDPIGTYDYLDRGILADGFSPTLTSASISGNTVTMYLPYTWRFTVNTGTPALENEQVLAPVEVATDFVAVSYAFEGVGSTLGVCVPTANVCAEGILSDAVAVDFAPGYELCSVALVSCAQYAPLGYDLGVENDYPVSSIITCFNPVNPAGPGLNGEITCRESAPPLSVFVYGRILPGPIVPFEGYNYRPFGSFVDDGLTFTG